MPQHKWKEKGHKLHICEVCECERNNRAIPTSYELPGFGRFGKAPACLTEDQRLKIKNELRIIAGRMKDMSNLRMCGQLTQLEYKERDKELKEQRYKIYDIIAGNVKQHQF